VDCGILDCYPQVEWMDYRWLPHPEQDAMGTFLAMACRVVFTTRGRYGTRP